MDYRIFPPEDLFEINIQLPESKSLAVRTIMLDFLSGHPENAAELAGICDDTRVLHDILASGLPTDGSTVDTGAAGTAIRFLCALAAATEGSHCILTGSGRLQERPIGPLVDALRSIGADIGYRTKDGFPPLEIKGRRLTGGTVEVDASVSSQFISALMMTAPLMASPLTIKLKGEVQSLPYLHMTARLMHHYGADAELERDRVEIREKKYKTAPHIMEPDWSAAAFWYEIVAISAAWVTLNDLRKDSLQGDSAAAQLFERLGTQTEFSDEGAELSATPELFNRLEADLTDMPDLAPALAVCAAMVGVPFRLSGLGALHDKECDRMQAIIDELAKAGILCETEAYGTVLLWDGRRVPISEIPVFDSHNDHRMAMALAPVSIFIPGIVIRGAECVSKSYPAYWHDLQNAGFSLIDPSQYPSENQQ